MTVSTTMRSIAAAVAAVHGFAALAAQGESSARSEPLEEVIVTAQKRQERLLDVAASISVLSGERLADLGVTQVIDYASSVPGLDLLSAGTPGAVTFILRGILTSAAAVGTFVDDSPFGASAWTQPSAIFQLDLYPYDIERVEILHGPQGALYGANTIGGVVRYVTRPPDLKEFAVRVGGDSSVVKNGPDLGWGARLGINVPVSADELGIRASYFRQRTPGYIDNAAADIEGQNEVTQEGGRLALLWAASDNLSVNLAAMVQQIEADGLAAVDALPPSAGFIVVGDLSRSNLVREPFYQRTESYSASINWNLGWAEFTSVSTLADTATQWQGDNTVGFAPVLFFAGFPPGTLAMFEGYAKLEKFAQELRLTSASHRRLQWRIGAFYTDEDGTRFGDIDAVNESQQTLAVLYQATLPITYEEYALFADLDYAASERLSLSAGGRWSHNEQVLRETANAPGGPPVDLLGRSSDEIATFVLSARYRLGERSTVYARVADGYVPGGTASLGLGVVPFPAFGPESVINYELGVKSEFLNRHVLLELALFTMDWDNMVLQTEVNGIGISTNAGTATSQGLEIAAGFAPAAGWRIDVSGAYIDAELTNDQSGFQAPPGARIPFVSELNASLRAEYKFMVSRAWTARFAGGFRYTGDRVGGYLPSGPGRTFPAYEVVDLLAGLSNDAWNLRLFARNLSDERAYFNGVNGPVAVSVLQPRTVGIGFDVGF